MPSEPTSLLKGPRLLLPAEARTVATVLSISPKLSDIEQQALNDILSQLRIAQGQLDSVRASFARLEFKLGLVTSELQATRRLVVGMGPSAPEATGQTEIELSVDE